MGLIIIGICGFVLGIAAVVALAVIGYLAEKKNDASNGKKTVVENVSTVTENVLNAYPSTNFDELPVVNDTASKSDMVTPTEFLGDEISSGDVFENVSEVGATSGSIPESTLETEISSGSVPENVSEAELTNGNVPESTLDNNISDVQTFSSSNFENVEMSLDDLEKKNYDELVSSNKNIDDDNYYYSNMEEDSTDASINELADESVQSSEPVTEESDSVQEVLNLDEQNVSGDSVPASEFFNDSSSNTVTDEVVQSNADSIPEVVSEETSEISVPVSESNEVSEVVDDHVFDGEVTSNDGIGDVPELGSNESDETQSVPENVEVPEIDNGFSVVNDESADDDIWKF